MNGKQCAKMLLTEGFKINPSRSSNVHTYCPELHVSSRAVTTSFDELGMVHCIRTPNLAHAIVDLSQQFVKFISLVNNTV